VTAQTGWAKERQLDRAGKTILVFCLVLFAMMLFMWFRVGMAAPWYL